MPEAIVKNQRIYYESHGQGYPLVLIRGLGSNADHWYAQLPEFSKHFRVVVFDNRGIARSGDPGGDFSIQDMADDTVGLLDALAIPQTHVLGVSMGGMIAQRIALDHPRRVRGLVLVVSHGGGAHQEPPSAEIARLVGEMVTVGTPESRIKALPAFFDPETLKTNLACAQTYAAVSLKYPADAKILSRQFKAIQAFDLYDRLPAIQAPTLVVASTGDVLIPPGNSEILAARIPDARLVAIPGGGHQILVEQPQACNQAVIDFLKTLAQPA
ncbi:MAG: alpha/beta fold hydrolase [Desulfatitalea sp.]|nr:alpha/beta fold hydrolase [Desulfatitalea sp.]MBI5894717.1 alpha/beta fold hydrolase [Desulfobacterales bacterium]